MGGRRHGIRQGICGTADKTAQGLHEERRRRGGDGISGGINVIGVEGVTEKGERQRSVAVRIRRRAAGCEGTRAASDSEIALAEIGVRSSDVSGTDAGAADAWPADAARWAAEYGVREAITTTQSGDFLANICELPSARANDLVDCGESHVSWPGPTAGVGRSRRDRRFVFRWPGDRDPPERSCGDDRALSRRGFG